MSLQRLPSVLSTPTPPGPGHCQCPHRCLSVPCTDRAPAPTDLSRFHATTQRRRVEDDWGLEAIRLNHQPVSPSSLLDARARTCACGPSCSGIAPAVGRKEQGARESQLWRTFQSATLVWSCNMSVLTPSNLRNRIYPGRYSVLGRPPVWHQEAGTRIPGHLDTWTPRWDTSTILVRFARPAELIAKQALVVVRGKESGSGRDDSPAPMYGYTSVEDRQCTKYGLAPSIFVARLPPLINGESFQRPCFTAPASLRSAGDTLEPVPIRLPEVWRRLLGRCADAEQSDGGSSCLRHDPWAPARQPPEPGAASPAGRLAGTSRWPYTSCPRRAILSSGASHLISSRVNQTVISLETLALFDSSRSTAADTSTLWSNSNSSQRGSIGHPREAPLHPISFHLLVGASSPGTYHGEAPDNDIPRRQPFPPCPILAAEPNSHPFASKYTPFDSNANPSGGTPPAKPLQQAARYWHIFVQLSKLPPPLGSVSIDVEFTAKVDGDKGKPTCCSSYITLASRWQSNGPFLLASSASARPSEPHTLCTTFLLSRFTQHRFSAVIRPRFQPPAPPHTPPDRHFVGCSADVVDQDNESIGLDQGHSAHLASHHRRSHRKSSSSLVRKPTRTRTGNRPKLQSPKARKSTSSSEALARRASKQNVSSASRPRLNPTSPLLPPDVGDTRSTLIRPTPIEERPKDARVRSSVICGVTVPATTTNPASRTLLPHPTPSPPLSPSISPSLSPSIAAIRCRPTDSDAAAAADHHRSLPSPRARQPSVGVTPPSLGRGSEELLALDGQPVLPIHGAAGVSHLEKRRGIRPTSPVRLVLVETRQKTRIGTWTRPVPVTLPSDSSVNSKSGSVHRTLLLACAISRCPSTPEPEAEGARPQVPSHPGRSTYRRHRQKRSPVPPPLDPQQYPSGVAHSGPPPI
ncbi:hypothetical protein RJ55_02795 [Drechmeria coniospora]|nr:hypothetical protein RJ55_02795 [Drechmeria coniospora]